MKICSSKVKWLQTPYLHCSLLSHLFSALEYTYCPGRTQAQMHDFARRHIIIFLCVLYVCWQNNCSKSSNDVEQLALLVLLVWEQGDHEARILTEQAAHHQHSPLPVHLNLGWQYYYHIILYNLATSWQLWIWAPHWGKNVLTKLEHSASEEKLTEPWPEERVWPRFSVTVSG